MGTIPLLTKNPETGKLEKTTTEWETDIPRKVFLSINKLILRKAEDGTLYLDEPIDVYHKVLAAVFAKNEAIKAGKVILDKGATKETYLIGTANLLVLSHWDRKIKPIREAYRKAEDLLAQEDVTFWDLGERLRSGTPMHVRAERALNYLSELCERILLTNRPVGETIVTAFAAYIVADGNVVEACKLAHISKNTWYAKWKTWCAWARAAAREYGERK